MTWGFPGAVWFALFALPVVAVFLYRRRARVMEVPAVDAWIDLGRPVETRSFRSLLRRLLTLLVQILLLTALVLALADPRPQGPPSQRTIIVLDVSYTMQTREADRTRLDVARQQAQTILDGLPEGGDVAIIQSAHCPMMVQALTKDRQIAKDKLQNVEALDVEGDLAGTVRLAGALAGADVPAKVVVISDFAAAAPKSLRDGWRSPSQIVFLPVGEDHPDAAITNFWCEYRAGQVIAQASVCSRGMSGKVVSLHLYVDGRLTGSHPVTLTDEPQSVSMNVSAPEGAVLQAVLDSGDRLEVDDRSWAVVSAHQQANVCLVTIGNPPLESAIKAGSPNTFRILRPEQYDGPKDGEVVIVDGVLLPPGTPGRAAGYLLIGTPDPFGWAVARGWMPADKISHWSTDHPCVRDVDPTAFHVSRLLETGWRSGTQVKRVVAAGKATVIAEASDSSMVSADSPRCVYWLFGLGESDLPRRMGFPLMLWNTIDYLGSGQAEQQPSTCLTGRPLVLRCPKEVKVPVVLGPDGKEVASRISGNTIVASGTTRHGVYRCEQVARPLAMPVNLSSTQALRPLPGDLQRPDEPRASGATFPGIDWLGRLAGLSWESLLLAAMLISTIDWVLFTRGVIRIG